MKLQKKEKSYLPMQKTNNTLFWPWPPASGPVPWTSKQQQEYNRQQREQQGEAPW